MGEQIHPGIATLHTLDLGQRFAQSLHKPNRSRGSPCTCLSLICSTYCLTFQWFALRLNRAIGQLEDFEFGEVLNVNDAGDAILIINDDQVVKVVIAEDGEGICCNTPEGDG